MFVVDGIAYAGDPVPPLKIVGVRPLEGHRLWIHFSSGTALPLIVALRDIRRAERMNAL